MSVTVAGTKNDICMIEAGAKESSEEDMLGALLFGQKYIKELCEFQEEIINVVGVEKQEVELATVPADLEKEVIKFAEDKMLGAIQIKNKLESLENHNDANIINSLNNKVDKVAGKKLSTEDFTTSEKNKLAGLESSKFIGQFVSLQALNSTYPTASIGNYAYVDLGIGEDVVKYI